MKIDWEQWGSWTIAMLILTTLILLIAFGAGCKGGGIFGPLNEGTHVDTPTERFQKAVKGTGWLIILAILGVGASAVAMFNGSKWAISSMIGSVLVLILSLVISKYAELLALLGLLCIVGAVGFVIYNVIVKKKALAELVRVIENVKPKLQNGDKEELFEDKNNPNSAVSIQSPATKKLVAEVREKINGEKK